jgi:hypothetical protein
MNKDSEALIFLVLFSSRKKELELVPLTRDGKVVWWDFSLVFKDIFVSKSPRLFAAGMAISF